MASAVIVAAGMGKRMGAGINKAYLLLGGKTILEQTVTVFENCRKIEEIVVVTDDTEKCRELLKSFKKVTKIVLGGATRQDSVKNGLKVCQGEFVAIHDGARALITAEKIEKVIEDAEKFGAAALGVKCKDTLKVSDEDGFIAKTLDRDWIYQIQTPQVFKRTEIEEAHSKINSELTDDCAVMEIVGKKVKITEGSYENIKITTPEDLIIAEKILEKRKNK
ncbi:MAG: 2-C-methyl-D-erythritol 4-phosphate cytidylyltransferase [Clostridia bacterium]|nr:2-C-methyl-D-erythritol 4-phosphate cytidylyltransferase [Clostridia bacterium]MBQ7751797.1 2-C-methyl-D-erythritol 4-phosphate cytidylyltransferase [Clostridia bacterium]